LKIFTPGTLAEPREAFHELTVVIRLIEFYVWRNLNSDENALLHRVIICLAHLASNVLLLLGLTWSIEIKATS
jgi:hypothetical protein